MLFSSVFTSHINPHEVIIYGLHLPLLELNYFPKKFNTSTSKITMEATTKSLKQQLKRFQSSMKTQSYEHDLRQAP